MQRLFQLFTEHGVLQRAQGPADRCGRSDTYFDMRRYFDMDPTRALVFATNYAALSAQPRARPLPMEPDAGDFAWVDPVAYVVVVRRLRLRFYASLMWRSYTVPPNSSTPCSTEFKCAPILSNVSRVHYSIEGSLYDRVATVPTSASSRGEDSLYSMHYANISIGICGYRCEGEAFAPAAGLVGTPAVDLISGRTFASLPAEVHVEPMQGLVLVRQ